MSLSVSFVVKSWSVANLLRGDRTQGSETNVVGGGGLNPLALDLGGTTIARCSSVNRSDGRLRSICAHHVRLRVPTSVRPGNSPTFIDDKTHTPPWEMCALVGDFSRSRRKTKAYSNNFPMRNAAARRRPTCGQVPISRTMLFCGAFWYQKLLLNDL